MSKITVETYSENDPIAWFRTFTEQKDLGLNEKENKLKFGNIATTDKIWCLSSSGVCEK